MRRFRVLAIKNVHWTNADEYGSATSVTGTTVDYTELNSVAHQKPLMRNASG